MKKFSKKLVLRKMTVANVGTEVMDMVQGGRPDPDTIPLFPSVQTNCATFCYPWKCPIPYATAAYSMVYLDGLCQ